MFQKTTLALCLVFLFSCKNGKDNKADANGSKPFPVVVVSQRNIMGYSDFPATIRGKNNSDVRAKIQGYITKVFVDEGQRVSRGQTLFTLETAMLTQQAKAAKAGVSASQSQVAAADASVQAAQAAVEIAQVEVNKLVPLVQKGIISDVQLETAKANYNAAVARLSQSKAAKTQAVAGTGQARANLQSVQANINYSVIKAPVSGIVGALPLREGNLVGPTDPNPLTTVSDTRELFAYFSMNESEYLTFLEKTPGKNITEKLKNIPKVELMLANGSMYSEKGEIEAVTGEIDPQTGTIQFRASFANKDGLLSNGNTGTIRIPKFYENVLVVPESATVDIQGIMHVFKVDSGKAISTVIKIAERVKNLAIVTDGIKAGDKIIAQGVGNIQNGTKVNPQLISIDSLVNNIKPVFK